MTFTSPTFVIFMAIFLPLYAITSGQWRLYLIFISSVIFYGWWDYRFLALIGTTITVDYFVSLQIHKTEDPRRRKAWLTMSLVINLGILFFFKYCNFFVNSIGSVARLMFAPTDLPFLEVILPVGISFYTFHSLSYTLDVYMRIMEPEKSWIRYASFVMFFPQLVAGPIARADYLLPQLHVDHQLKWTNFLSGMQLVVWGFFMKCVIADTQAGFVDSVFLWPQQHSSISLAVAVLIYSFQIYGDFAGYSFIAIGLGEILGFDLRRNFDRPYFSTSFSEFWQRWHISLSSWLRDYLYKPLGGNRHGTLNTYRNLMLTMLIGGIWHGASWNFVIWGGLHGVYLVIQRLLAPAYQILVTSIRIPTWLLQPVSMLFVFSLTCLTWVFFRAQSLEIAIQIIYRIVFFDGQGLDSLSNKIEAIRGLLLIGLLLICEWISFRIPVRQTLAQQPWLAILTGAAVIWTIAFFGTFGGNSFIYFQF